MGNIAYDQFAAWCKHWNYSVEEGFRAMCFTSNIINQHYGNCVDYANKVSNNDNHSSAFKDFAKTKKEDADHLLRLYENLYNAIFEMLEEHDNNIT